MLFYYLIALLAGVAAATQAAVNSQLAAGLGGQPVLAALVSFAVGTVFLALAGLGLADVPRAWAALPRQPLWLWLGGVLGAGFVLTMVVLAPRVGIVNLLFCIIVGQLLAATVIDHWGLLRMPARPMNWSRLLGLSVMALGLGLFFFGERLARALAQWGKA
ncbi:DMT family transporter [Comamonadaceae bacterium OH2545_COT-014]|nr:DMT family transporter [Comamonadaceae bacterium OH2545_COT-014]